jgi:hypothetical protein
LSRIKRQTERMMAPLASGRCGPEIDRGPQLAGMKPREPAPASGKPPPQSLLRFGPDYDTATHYRGFGDCIL